MQDGWGLLNAINAEIATASKVVMSMERKFRMYGLISPIIPLFFGSFQKAKSPDIPDTHLLSNSPPL